MPRKQKRPPTRSEWIEIGNLIKTAAVALDEAEGLLVARYASGKVASFERVVDRVTKVRTELEHRCSDEFPDWDEATRGAVFWGPPLDPAQFADGDDADNEDFNVELTKCPDPIPTPALPDDVGRVGAYVVQNLAESPTPEIFGKAIIRVPCPDGLPGCEVLHTAPFDDVLVS
jgi:hypothetical protein